MIHVLTGWGNEGGSTTAFINLVNLFNDNGYYSCLYSPHTWHFDKCISDSLLNNNLNSFDKDDIVIAHFIKLDKRILNIRKSIFSSHEQNIFPLNQINYKIFDKIHYVSNHQKSYHNIDHPYFIIPNVLDNLKPNKKPTEKIGAIIGSIDKNKNITSAIHHALNDNCKKVLIYGKITDKSYYDNFVQPLLMKYKNILYLDYCNNKQQMYDSCTDVYNTSLMESWGYMKAECQLTDTIFHNISNSVEKDVEVWDKKRILNEWIKQLEL
jgi:hypothetical protein